MTLTNRAAISTEVTPSHNMDGPSFFLGKGFSPTAAIASLSAQMNSTNGGIILQSNLYADPMSSLEWLQIVKQSDYQNVASTFPYKQISELIDHMCDNFDSIQEIDFIALGAGSAEKESRLVQHLAQLMPNKKINLYLLEVSQPLLVEGYKNAVASMASVPNVGVRAIMADMNDLSKMINSFSPTIPGRRRIIAMLGFTFSNLPNELLFIRNSLRGTNEADMFLIDFSKAVASADQPEEIYKKEPRLASTKLQWDGAVEKWLKGPIMRYCDGVKEVELYDDLDMATCCIPGSYAITRHAKVLLENGQERDFTMFFFKRYDTNKLALRMKQEGWGFVGGSSFGFDNELMLYLFKKQPNKVDHP